VYGFGPVTDYSVWLQNINQGPLLASIIGGLPDIPTTRRTLVHSEKDLAKAASQLVRCSLLVFSCFQNYEKFLGEMSAIILATYSEIMIIDARFLYAKIPEILKPVFETTSIPKITFKGQTQFQALSRDFGIHPTGVIDFCMATRTGFLSPSATLKDFRELLYLRILAI